MKGKYLTSMILILLIAVSMRPSIAAQDGSGIEIAIVYSTGGKGDLSFNDAAYRGVLELKDKYPAIKIDEAEPTTVDEINTAIENFASSDTVYDLIIGIGFTAFDGINASASAHTDRNFMIVDSVVDLPNVASVVFAEHEGSFLAGAMAAMVSETGIIGFLGGLDIPLINKFRYGYEQGAKYINPEIKVLATYSPDPTNPWGDLSGGKTIAENFMEDGADVIYAAAGGTGLGVIQAVNETDNAYAIGVDSNQDYLAKGKVLTSMVKKVEVAVTTQVEAVIGGTWSNGLTTLGLKEKGVGITDMEYTQAEANTIYADGKTRMDVINEITQKIIDGDIVVKEDSGAIDVSTSFTSIILSTPEQYLSDKETAPFPVFSIIASIGLVSVILRKRKN